MFEPTIFGRYVLLKRIAIGGMAEIFRSIAYGAEGFEKVVAIKRMLAHLSSDAQFVDMFINEAKLAAGLNHTNIVQIYDFGCINNLLFLCMEYVRGKDVSEITGRLKARQLAAPPELACHVFIKVLNGLHHAHNQRDRFGKPMHLIHRDVSPPNLIVSYDGEVKIADFGIAKATRTKVQTSSGVLKGKYSYMSPEQATGQPLDPRSDVFSAAICLCEMLTLNEMFTGNSELEVLRRVREADFVRPRELRPDLPQELEDILCKALARDRDERYPGATAFREDLERFMVEQGFRFSTSSLTAFMEDLFSKEIEQSHEQLANESKLAESLRPQIPSVSELGDEGAGELETLIVTKGEQKWPPGFDPDAVRCEICTGSQVADHPPPVDDDQEEAPLDENAFGGEGSLDEDTLRVGLSELMQDEKPASTEGRAAFGEDEETETHSLRDFEAAGFSDMAPTVEESAPPGQEEERIVVGTPVVDDEEEEDEPDAPAAEEEEEGVPEPDAGAWPATQPDETYEQGESGEHEEHEAVDRDLEAYLQDDEVFEPAEAEPEQPEPKTKTSYLVLLLVLLGATVLGGLAAYLIIHGTGDTNDGSAEPADVPPEAGEAPPSDQGQLGLDLSAGDTPADGGQPDAGGTVVVTTGPAPDAGQPKPLSQEQADAGVKSPPADTTGKTAAGPDTAQEQPRPKKKGLFVDGREVRSLRHKLAPGTHVMELRGRKGKLVRRWKVEIGEDGR